jgi:tRNA(Ile)-lysidine synthase
MLMHFVDTAFSFTSTDKIAVAVSGGGDSMALLHLYTRWSAQTGVPVIAATVNHGLRPEAADESAFVAAFCARHDIEHSILDWDGTQAAGNVQAAARNARYDLIAQWALLNGADGVVLGHTADDIAETFLMRLARKSGVDGLAAMPAYFKRNGIAFARPLWQQTRAELREYLRRHDVAWIEDPSNEDLSQTRPKARQILEALGPLGIDADGLKTTAAALSQAKGALQSHAAQEARRVVTFEAGDVVIPKRPRPPIHPETERRLHLAAVQYVNGADYPPREMAMIHLDVALIKQDHHTVAGCLISKTADGLRFARELNACEGAIDWGDRTDSVIWDGRWEVGQLPDCQAVGNLRVAALGDDLSQVPDWRDIGLPRSSLMASPAVFDGDTLISAPLAGLQNGFSARIVADFTSFLVSR